MAMHSKTGRRQEELTEAFVDQAAAVDTLQFHCLYQQTCTSGCECWQPKNEPASPHW